MAPGDQPSSAPHRPRSGVRQGVRPARGVFVTVCDERGRARLPGLGSWLAGAAPARARGVVHLALVSDGRVRKLNRQYRRRDDTTDVLSFPASSPSSRDGVRPVAEPSPFLGDIVIARGVARRQARRAGHDGETELRVLALHGLLHLLGYDHERDTGQMARLERRLRRRAGLTDGLIERAKS
ncbi:MAG: rRNA maturation RNase YbeY [Luteitalea sp.]|nr:rRNA maturation RNase YbeY [Luteitalea sp.]